VAFQVIQIFLALLTVAAYAALQLHFARPDDLRYLLPNLVSSAGLTVAAVVAFQLGFVIK
jgi:hypothetical protein